MKLGFPVLILLGPSSSGRTSVGNALARLLEAPFVETEDVLQSALSTSFSRLALNTGADELSELVQAAAAEQLKLAAIVSLLPSALESDSVTATIAELSSRGIPLVAVSAETATLVRRSGLNAPRSAALGQPRKWFGDFVRSHRERYRDLGASEFDTTNADPQAVAEEIVAKFGLQ